MESVKLTPQETNIINYLSNKDVVGWEELAQFSKNPQTVKLKTIQKSISNLKRKYTQLQIPFPFNGKFEILSKQDIQPDSNQKIVQVKKTPNGSFIKANEISAHKDFILNFNTKQVLTKYGYHSLNDREWDVLKYLHSNVSKVISLSELRDKVVYEKFGSKLPARWFDHIKCIIGNLRAHVPGLRERILTVKGSIETGYLFQ